MMFRSPAAALWVVLSIVSFTPLGSAASLQEITSFGDNPTKTRMFIYVPDKLATKPAVLVSPHWCHGSAQDVYKGKGWAPKADKYGFIIIYPDSPNLSDKCWDVSSNQSLTHFGGGDALGIVSMVNYTLNTYKADPDRVFVTGISSGAMMTNVLAGSYPDVFAAGSAWAGVPFGCYAGKGFGLWSDSCATGKIIKTGVEWARMIWDAYPHYTGYRPKMQIAHGTADNVLFPQNFNETVKQWTTVFGLNSTQANVTVGTPSAIWTRYSYGPKFEAYLAEGVTHDIQVQEDVVMAWFDLACTEGPCFSRKSGMKWSGRRKHAKALR